MASFELTPELLGRIAERFRALSEPTRLMILNALRSGERTVSALVEETGLGQANVSKHLQLLRSHHFVDRRKEGLFVHYRIVDPDIFRLCEIMCGRIEERAEADRRLLATNQ